MNDLNWNSYWFYSISMYENVCNVYEMWIIFILKKYIFMFSVMQIVNFNNT